MLLTTSWFLTYKEEENQYEKRLLLWPKQSSLLTINKSCSAKWKIPPLLSGGNTYTTQNDPPLTNFSPPFFTLHRSQHTEENDPWGYWHVEVIFAGEFYFPGEGQRMIAYHFVALVWDGYYSLSFLEGNWRHCARHPTSSMIEGEFGGNSILMYQCCVSSWHGACLHYALWWFISLSAEYVFAISTPVVQRCHLDINRLYSLLGSLELAYRNNSY